MAVEGRCLEIFSSLRGARRDVLGAVDESLETVRGFRVLGATVLCARLCVEVEEGVALMGLPAMRDSLALDRFVWRTLGAFDKPAGTGRALNAGFFCSSSVSFFVRSSRAALSFAATASPGSWNVEVVLRRGRKSQL